MFDMIDFIVFLCLHGFVLTLLITKQRKLFARNKLTVGILNLAIKKIMSVIPPGYRLVGLINMLEENVLSDARFNFPKDIADSIWHKLKNSNDSVYGFFDSGSEYLSQSTRDFLARNILEHENTTDAQVVICLFAYNSKVWTLREFSFKNPFYQLLIPVIGPWIVLSNLLRSPDGALCEQLANISEYACKTTNIHQEYDLPVPRNPDFHKMLEEIKNRLESGD